MYSTGKMRRWIPVSVLPLRLLYNRTFNDVLLNGANGASYGQKGIERRQVIDSQILQRKSIAIWSCKSDHVDLGLIWLVFRSFQKDNGLFDDSKSLDNIHNINKNTENSIVAFGLFCNYWILKQMSFNT